MGSAHDDGLFYGQEAKRQAEPRQGLAAKWDGIDAFNVDQVAEILGLGVNSVYAAVAAGTIPCLQIGRRKIIGRPALERLPGYR